MSNSPNSGSVTISPVRFCVHSIFITAGTLSGGTYQSQFAFGKSSIVFKVDARVRGNNLCKLLSLFYDLIHWMTLQSNPKIRMTVQPSFTCDRSGCPSYIRACMPAWNVIARTSWVETYLMRNIFNAVFDSVWAKWFQQCIYFMMSITYAIWKATNSRQALAG